jgi:hypothetical protein
MFKLVGVCGIFPEVAVPVVQRAHGAAGLRTIPAYIGTIYLPVDNKDALWPQSYIAKKSK